MSTNRTIKKQILGLIKGPVVEHLDKLEGFGGLESGNPNDLRNRQDWIKHLNKALNNIDKKLERLRKPLWQVLKEQGYNVDDIVELIQRIRIATGKNIDSPPGGM
jgi:hypothetical protein